jgi:outer membrane protein insertion porin family
LILLLLMLVLVRPAAAQEVPWYVGLPVAQVSLENAQGALPPENLAPLLRIRQGEPLDTGLVRADVRLLARAGEFASVDVRVEPWLLLGPDDTLIDAVRVIYLVKPAPRIQQIVVEGVAGPARETVDEVLGLQRGEAFYSAVEVPRIEARIRRALVASGWPSGQAAVRSQAQEDGTLAITVAVSAGEERVVGSVRLAGDEVVSQRRVYGWLGAVGLASGKRLSSSTLKDARDRVVQELSEMGWSEARVNLVADGGEAGGPTEVRVLIAAGLRIQIRRQGTGLPGLVELREIMGLSPGAASSERALSDAAKRIELWFRERGFLDAAVTVRREEQDGGERLFVNASRGPLHRVKKIVVSGADDVGSSRVQAAVRSADQTGYGEGLVIQDGEVRAMKAIAELYRGVGYLSASVEIENQSSLRAGFVGLPLRFGVATTVLVTVVEGPKTVLTDLVLEGALPEVLSQLEARRAALVNAALSPVALDALVEAMVAATQEEGYLDASGTLKLSFSPDQTKAKATIRLDPGERVRLRSVVIRGNTRTRRHVIARELALEVGGLVTPQRVDRTRSALYDLELFRHVRFDLVGEDPRSRDLLLQVEERQNIVLEAGGGVSTDEGLLARGRATHRNIAGLGQRLSFLGQIGYGWVGDEWSLDTAVPVWRAAARYEFPYVPGRGHRLVLEGLLHETVQEPTWRLSRSGGSASLKMRLSRETEVVFDYRLQQRRLEDVDPGALVNGDPWIPLLGLAPDLSGQIVTTSGPLVYSGGSILVYRDSRDDRFAPTRGGTSSTHLELGDGAFSGLATIRASTRVERLVPIGPLVLDLVGAGGIGWAEGRAVTLPLEDRFYLGGGSTLRGFDLNSVGPANLTSRPEVRFPSQIQPVIDGISLRESPAHWVATGGDTFLAMTVELRIPLPLLGLRSLESTSLTLFSDTGHVGFLDPRIITTSGLQGRDPLVRTSFGAGLRIATPIGPAAFDLGINPSPMSEREESWILPHLSLGVL